jgi:hypothetical protein
MSSAPATLPASGRAGVPPPRSEKRLAQSGRLGTIRKDDVVDSVRLAAISNRTRCRLEIAVGCSDVKGNRTQAGHARATKGSGELSWVHGYKGDLGTIRKSDLVDSVGLAAISNCTRCRLEIAGGVGFASGLRADAGRLRVRNWEKKGRTVTDAEARIGGVPAVVRPAASGTEPRRMCVWWRGRFSAANILP